MTQFKDKGKEAMLEIMKIIGGGDFESEEMETIMVNVLGSVAFNIYNEGYRERGIEHIAHNAKLKIPIILGAKHGNGDPRAFKVNINKLK